MENLTFIIKSHTQPQMSGEPMCRYEMTFIKGHPVASTTLSSAPIPAASFSVVQNAVYQRNSIYCCHLLILFLVDVGTKAMTG
jgi:hypothetical protein